MKPSCRFTDITTPAPDVLLGINEYNIVSIPSGVEFYAKVGKEFEVEVEFRDKYTMFPTTFRPRETSQLVVELKNRLSALVKQSCEMGLTNKSLAVTPPVFIHGVVRFMSVFWSACEFRFQSHITDKLKYRLHYADTLSAKIHGEYSFSNTMQIVVMDMVHEKLNLERGYIPRRVEVERVVRFFNELVLMTAPSKVEGRPRIVVPEDVVMTELFTVPRIVEVQCDTDFVEQASLVMEVFRVLGSECRGLRFYSKTDTGVLDVYV